MDKKSREDIYRLLVRAAIQEDIEHSEEMQKDDKAEDHVFSDSFHKKMEKLFQKERRKQWRKTHKRTLYKVGAIAASFILVSSILVTKVDALRLPISNFLWRVTEKYTDITPQKMKYTVSKEKQKYMPDFIPDGFVITDVDEQKNEVCVTYENDEGKVYIFDFWMHIPDTAVDTEHATIEEVPIQNTPATVIEKQDRTYIIWTVHGHQYSVEGYITREEGLDILKSIDITNQ